MTARWLGTGSLAMASLLVLGCNQQSADGDDAAHSGEESILANPELTAWATTAPARFLATFETTAGTFVIEVTRAWAPRGADRFYNLVRHGFYDDQRVFRVREGYIAQFGLPGDPAITPAWLNNTMQDDPVLASNKRGYVAYAMTGPDTRTTQVYINYIDNTHLDAQGFAPFGQVIDGMDAVDAFYSEYDETAGGGMRGGKQGKIVEEGNAHLDRDFPMLDRIVKATVR